MAKADAEMLQRRRNLITRAEAGAIAATSAGSAVIAALAGASPTGATVPDAALVAGFAAAVTWLGASAPWWALLTASGIALAGALPGPTWVVVVAALAVTGSAWIGWSRTNEPVARAVIAAAVVQVALRLEWNEFFLFSALLAAVATLVIGVSGFVRRRRYVRRRIVWTTIGVGVLAVLAVVGLGVAGVQARESASDGYVGLLDGLEYLQDGNVTDAQAVLQQAAADLDDAHEAVDGPFTQLARFVPGVAQNRDAGADVLARAADAAGSAAATLRVVDLDQLTVTNGAVDVTALAELQAPLAELDRTVGELHDALVAAESDWLVPPFRSRLDDGIRRAGQAAHQAEATAAAARVGPALLGADEPRRYLLAFVNNAEARGTSGLMGNWTEITVDDGRMRVTANGRTARLQDDALYDIDLDASDEYVQRYAPYGAGFRGGVAQKYWSNVTVPADMPSVGTVMAQMYEAVTDRVVDGVFVIDPAGVAGLLEITGSVDLPDIDQRIDAGNAEQFLTLDQYEFAESEREDLISAVTEATVANVLGSTLPPPQDMAPALAPAVLEGHLSAWAADPAEQELFELVGMDGALPRIDTSGTDALAVVNVNGGTNKIDSFLERTIEYRPVVDQRTGRVEASLVVSLTNTAPSTGYEDYVIGNRVDLPRGTNRSIVDVYTRLEVDAVRVDGDPVAANTLPELGYNVHASTVVIPPGDTVVMEFDLSGEIGAGAYELVYRPQPLPRPGTLVVDARTTGGNRIFEFDGVVERRSVMDADGVTAWR